MPAAGAERSSALQLMGFLLGPKPPSVPVRVSSGLWHRRLPPPCLGSCRRLAVELEEGEGRAEGEGILAFI